MWFKSKNEDNFKLVSFKTYAWDRTINNTRRYRKVFDKNELNYLSVAFEFYNKHFDEKDWNTTVNFKCFKLDTNGKTSLICESTEDYEISKDANSFICDYGYGNDEYGSYWEAGDYIWDLTVNDEFIASAKFYIYDLGKVTNSHNPYFTVDSIEMFENVINEDNEIEGKFYLKQFLHNQTRYIMTELNITNKVNFKWLCELFYNYYDDSGVLVGSSNDLDYINVEDKEAGTSFTFESGWGSEDPTVWLKDNYRVEVVFMDTVIAQMEFSVGDEFIEMPTSYEVEIEDENLAGSNSNNNLESENNQKPDEKDPENKEEDKTGLNYTYNTEHLPLDELLQNLDGLIGLTEIKNRIRDYMDYVKFLQLRNSQGIKDEEKIKLHSVFTGNPGTGKTTVVKLLGQIYYAMGLLSKGHVLTVESSDLVSGFVRQTGKNTKDFIEKARGGILFIDEAYMLYKGESANDFGPEAIAALITEMSDGPGDIAIMVAGYPKEMEALINSNPGLKSRFKNHYHFKDYTPNELVAIALYTALKREVNLSENAVKKLKKIATQAYRNRTRSFGNARFINSIIDEAKMNLGIRLMRSDNTTTFTKESLTTILEQDIEDVSKQSISEAIALDVDHALLQNALNELEALTGLNSIKKEVQELIKLVKYYKEIDRDVLKAFSMHSIFIGNPGTGKTTVARILGKVYKALGLLERGHLVEADGSSLIAGFVGQTALKTKELIKAAKGGILFIDEAYSITEGSASANNFGKKAIAALLKEMEDHRGEFGVIVAGYTDNMKSFLKSNPGLKSRFDTTYHFEDFGETELYMIALNMFGNKDLIVNAKAGAHIRKYISQLHENKSKYFGNARAIRKLVEKASRNQQLRMANIEKLKRTKKMMTTLTLDDVKEFDSTKELVLKSTAIGYKTK